MSEVLPPVPPPSWRERAAALHERAATSPGGVLVGAVAAVAVVIVVVLVARGSGPAPPIRLPQAAPSSVPPTTETVALIHVAGAVVHPGLYRLPPGSRVGDAATEAGGPTSEADLDAVNLAAKVGDGDRVYVPKRGEAPPVAAAGAPAGGAPAAPVDVNLATAEQLDALPGVGPSLAAAIVQYRQQHGRFRSVDELERVPGIGPAKLARLRPHVRA